ncbi:MAG: flavodoxin family protein [Desulfobacterales bacterium]|nr:flavodoxin family protein [Desulfobacterales bacterium]
MNLLAIIGSPRKGKATDTLVDKAIEGVIEKTPEASIKKIYLSDNEINYCKDCLTCWRQDIKDPLAKCVIRDDMDVINQDILNADSLIIGTPIHMGYTTALMMTFLERICWTFAKPTKSYFIVKGCPEPRSDKKRKAIIIGVSGMIPTKYKKLCNCATPQIKGVIKDSLNAKTVGDLYAGDVWNQNVEQYFDKAFKLGQKLK